MNTIHLTGAVCAEPQLKYTPSGLAILELPLAGKGERTWYHRVTIFGKQAEQLAETAIGTIVSVLGRLDHQRWEKDGAKRSAVKVIADAIGTTTGTTTPDARSQPVMDAATNTVLLAGNLTRDPETRETSNGEVTNATIAVNEYRKDSEYTHFIDVSRWNAPIPGSKGARVGVIGELRTRSFEGKSGERQYRTEVVASDVLAPDTQPAKRLDIDDEFPALPDLPF